MASNSRSTAKNRVNNDPVDELKRRARRRLVGAIALFLAAVIVVPALVENEPAQTPSKVELIVPDRPSSDITADVKSKSSDKTAEKPDQSAHSSPASKLTNPTPSTDEQEPMVIPPLATVKAEPKPEPKPDSKPEPKPEPKPAQKVESKPAEKPALKSETKAESKTEPKTESKADTKSAAKADSKATAKSGDDLIAKFADEVFWVQVAAVGDKARAESLKQELSGKGFSARIESTHSNGSTVYRVRVGPLNGQDKADAAKAKLIAAGYSGRVVQ